MLRRETIRGSFVEKLTKPERPPRPGLANHVASDGPLCHKKSHLVLPQAVVDPPGVVGTDGGLHHCNQVVDAVISDLLHETKNTSAEENFSVTILETQKCKLEPLKNCIFRPGICRPQG